MQKKIGRAGASPSRTSCTGIPGSPGEGIPGFASTWGPGMASPEAGSSFFSGRPHSASAAPQPSTQGRSTSYASTAPGQRRSPMPQPDWSVLNGGSNGSKPRPRSEGGGSDDDAGAAPPRPTSYPETNTVPPDRSTSNVYGERKSNIYDSKPQTHRKSWSATPPKSSQKSPPKAAPQSPSSETPPPKAAASPPVDAEPLTKDPSVASIAQLEEDLKATGSKDQNWRRQHFRELLLRWHPDKGSAHPESASHAAAVVCHLLGRRSRYLA